MNGPHLLAESAGRIRSRSPARSTAARKTEASSAVSAARSVAS